MHSEDLLSWRRTKNSVKDRLEDDSFIHTFSIERETSNTTRNFNKSVKKLRIRDYETFKKYKRDALASENASFVNESDVDQAAASEINNMTNTKTFDPFVWHYIIKNKPQGFTDQQQVHTSRDEEHISQIPVWEPNVEISTGNNEVNVHDKSSFNIEKGQLTLDSWLFKKDSAVSPSHSNRKLVEIDKSVENVKKNLSSVMDGTLEFCEQEWNDFTPNQVQAQSTMLSLGTHPTRRSDSSLLSTDAINQPRDSGIDEDSREDNCKNENGIGALSALKSDDVCSKSETSQELQKTIEKDLNGLKLPLKIIGEQKVTKKYKIISRKGEELKPIVEENVDDSSSSVDHEEEREDGACEAESDSSEYLDSQDGNGDAQEKREDRACKTKSDSSEYLDSQDGIEDAQEEREDRACKAESDGSEYLNSQDAKDSGSDHSECPLPSNDTESAIKTELPESESDSETRCKKDLKNNLKRCRSPWLKNQYKEMKRLRLLEDSNTESEFDSMNKSSFVKPRRKIDKKLKKNETKIDESESEEDIPKSSTDESDDQNGKEVSNVEKEQVDKFDLKTEPKDSNNLPGSSSEAEDGEQQEDGTEKLFQQTKISSPIKSESSDSEIDSQEEKKICDGGSQAKQTCDKKENLQVLLSEKVNMTLDEEEKGDSSSEDDVPTDTKNRIGQMKRLDFMAESSDSDCSEAENQVTTTTTTTIALKKEEEKHEAESPKESDSSSEEGIEIGSKLPPTDGDLKDESAKASPTHSEQSNEFSCLDKVSEEMSSNALKKIQQMKKLNLMANSDSDSEAEIHGIDSTRANDKCSSNSSEEDKDEEIVTKSENAKTSECENPDYESKSDIDIEEHKISQDFLNLESAISHEQFENERKSTQSPSCDDTLQSKPEHGSDESISPDESNRLGSQKVLKLDKSPDGERELSASSNEETSSREGSPMLQLEIKSNESISSRVTIGNEESRAEPVIDGNDVAIDESKKRDDEETQKDHPTSVNEIKVKEIERITEVSQLVEKENLDEISCEATFDLDDILSDEEIFLLQVPRKAFKKNLVGKKLKLSKNTLALGKHNYESFRRTNSTQFSCAFKSGKTSKHALRIQNMRPSASIVTRGKKLEDDSVKRNRSKEQEDSDSANEFRIDSLKKFHDTMESPNRLSEISGNESVTSRMVKKVVETNMRIKNAKKRILKSKTLNVSDILSGQCAQKTRPRDVSDDAISEDEVKNKVNNFERKSSDTEIDDETVEEKSEDLNLEFTKVPPVSPSKIRKATVKAIETVASDKERKKKKKTSKKAKELESQSTSSWEQTELKQKNIAKKDRLTKYTNSESTEQTCGSADASLRVDVTSESEFRPLKKVCKKKQKVMQQSDGNAEHEESRRARKLAKEKPLEKKSKQKKTKEGDRKKFLDSVVDDIRGMMERTSAANKEKLNRSSNSSKYDALDVQRVSRRKRHITSSSSSGGDSDDDKNKSFKVRTKEDRGDASSFFRNLQYGTVAGSEPKSESKKPKKIDFEE